MTHIDLATVDVDGAVREAGAATGGDTRAQFFRKAAISGGAAISAGGFLGMLPALADARPSKKQDLAILNYALTLEELEAAFYRGAVARGGLKGHALAAAKLLASHESTHVTALRQTIRSLGGRAIARPAFDFKGANHGHAFLPTALVLENTGVHAYLGQAGRLQSKALLAAAASIVTVEARHAGAIALLLGRSPFSGANSISPDGAFDTPKTRRQILKAVEATGFIKG